MGGSRTERSSPDLRSAVAGPLDPASAVPIIHQPAGVAACPGSVPDNTMPDPSIHPTNPPPRAPITPYIHSFTYFCVLRHLIYNRDTESQWN